MDPQVTFEEMAALFAAGQLDEAKEKARDLRRWVESRGFPPTITGHAAFDRLVTRAACTAVLER